ncbi:MAG: choice-of-anchor D domain-containing protein, partial [Terriglobales bacterium]
EVIEKAFHVKMNQYQHPTENRRFYAPDREPTVDLPFQLWRIAGLDNYSKPKPEYVRKDEASTTVKPNAVFGSGPDRSFLGSDMRAAYYGGTTLTGAGQTLGLLEFAGTELSDLKTYYANIGQTINTPIVLLSVDGTSLDCFAWQLCDDTEQTLDMTQALGMAPGLSKLVVYIGSTPDGLLNAMATYDAPPDAQLSSSWSWALSDWTADDPYFEEFAAQGQSFLQAAGDSGSWTENYFPTATPLDSVYVTSVGGTALSTKTAGGAWASEDAWMDSGGGTSRYLRSFGIPSWQVTTAESCLFWCDTTYRNGPDVSAEANFDFYVCADQEGCFTEIGGTSFAAPMWAAFLALINQQAAASGESTIGFANPLLYEIGQGTKYTKAFHDITEGGNGMYVATTGYDLVTGWGSPNGVGLINAMVAGNVTPTVTLSPTSLTFAKTAVGEMSAAKTITLKNTSAGLLNLSKMFASSGFEISSNACGRTLAAKTSCKLTVTFTPSQVGTAMGTITLVDNAANSPQTVTLSGTGK